MKVFFYEKITNLLNIKKKQKAFHPNANRQTIYVGSKIFCFKRESIDKKQIILCATNLSSKNQFFRVSKNFLKFRNLLGGKMDLIKDRGIRLNPFQTVWLSNL